MSLFRQEQKPAGEGQSSNVVDLAPRVVDTPIPDDEGEMDQAIADAAARHGYRSDAPTVKPRLRRRAIEEPQDVITMQIRRSIVDKFDLWCAAEGFTKKDGFEEMVRRVTRNRSKALAES